MKLKKLLEKIKNQRAAVEAKRSICAEIVQRSKTASDAEISQIETEARTANQELEDEERKLNDLIAELESFNGEETVVERGSDRIVLGSFGLDARGNTSQEVADVRSSDEYALAYARGIYEDNNFAEARALLSEQATDGSVPIPTVLDTEIRNAWNECKLLSKAKLTYFKGNVKVGFEVSATDAVVHKEGDKAPDEGEVVWGVVELKASNIKDWITVSDEAIDFTSISVVNELYKLIAQKIAEKAEEVMIEKIVNSPAETTKEACGVPSINVDEIAADTIATAVAELSGKAKNLILAMNRRTKPLFTKIRLNANYFNDIFDGLEENIVYTDALPAFSEATAGQKYLVIGDAGYGFQANLPNGNQVKMKYDDLSLAEKDLVKIVGRMPVGMEVVAPKAFVTVGKTPTV